MVCTEAVRVAVPPLRPADGVAATAEPTTTNPNTKTITIVFDFLFMQSTFKPIGFSFDTQTIGAAGVNVLATG
jgi:hypothetical protein